jgi:hypothetical protein
MIASLADAIIGINVLEINDRSFFAHRKVLAKQN